MQIQRKKPIVLINEAFPEKKQKTIMKAVFEGFKGINTACGKVPFLKWKYSNFKSNDLVNSVNYSLLNSLKSSKLFNNDCVNLVPNSAHNHYHLEVRGSTRTFDYVFEIARANNFGLPNDTIFRQKYNQFNRNNKNLDRNQIDWFDFIDKNRYNNPVYFLVTYGSCLKRLDFINIGIPRQEFDTWEEKKNLILNYDINTNRIFDDDFDINDIDKLMITSKKGLSQNKHLIKKEDFVNEENEKKSKQDSKNKSLELNITTKKQQKKDDRIEDDLKE